MRLHSISAVAICALGMVVAGTANAAPPDGLEQFGSQAELSAWLAALPPQEMQDEECLDPDLCPENTEVEEIVVTGSRVSAPAQAAASITNNQEAGVDEGDIVKMRGDTLIILRRGRLFTVDTAGGGLSAVDTMNAYAPGVNGRGDWYDEMLVSGDWVVVIGYSYRRDGTIINRFRLDRRGRIRFVDSHSLPSEDYYSSRNYASRLVGDRLMVYAPLDIQSVEDTLEDPPQLIPLDGENEGRGTRLLRPRDIYRPPTIPGQTAMDIDVLHIVTRCDLARPRLTCRATGILGPESRNFYVGPSAVYVWMTENSWRRRSADQLPRSFLYQIPLDSTAPRAARVQGQPTDQFSFAEDDERLRVLVRSQGGGDAMWRPEFTRGSVALLDLPRSRFGDGLAEPDAGDYRILPRGPENAWRFVNRFTDKHVLYSLTAPGGAGGASMVNVVPLDGGQPVAWLLAGGVERIEPVGDDALIVSRLPDSVAFSTINLERDLSRSYSTAPTITNTFVLASARGAETRSHAFFYQPDPSSPNGEWGVMGLPVIRILEQDNDLFDEAADMAFLRRGNDRVRSLGTLNAYPDLQADDACVASCVDWYGDARPIFVGDRIFALLGYELVEGRVVGNAIREIRRVSLAPSVRRERQD